MSPKLQELGDILEEIQADGEHKIIIFSEWQRMLELVRDHLQDLGLGYAWHTGQVPQPQRRKEIRRFRQDDDCRVFLSTDSGAVGLNLQVADVVINLDLPWNPAKLEQRIARAWRKHQQRPVQVINLITEDSIEHRMVSLLEQKRSLAEGVVDGEGEAEMELPSGRAAFLERVEALVGERPEAQKAAPADPVAAFGESVRSQWADVLDRVELHGEADARVLIAVAERPDAELASALQQQLAAQFPEHTPELQLLERSAHAAIAQLIEAGVLQFGSGAAELLHEAPAHPVAADDTDAARARVARQAEARARLEPSRRQLRMAQVLGDGGFRRGGAGPAARGRRIGAAVTAALAGTRCRAAGQPGTGRCDPGAGRATGVGQSSFNRTTA